MRPQHPQSTLMELLHGHGAPGTYPYDERKATHLGPISGRG